MIGTVGSSLRISVSGRFEKEVIRIIVSEEQANMVFEAMFLAGKLDTPGQGIMYMSKLDRLATFVPESLIPLRSADAR